MTRKKILILSTGDTNGAYEMMYNVSKVLIDLGHDVVMCVKTKTKGDNFIKEYLPNHPNYSLFKRIIRKAKQRLVYTSEARELETDPKYSFISIDEDGSLIDTSRLLQTIGFTPEIVFTGMTTWFMNSWDLKDLYKETNAQIYNITVDMNHFTGGCHFSWGCEGYVKGCDNSCPAILTNEYKNLAAKNFLNKQSNAKEAKFKIIAASGHTFDQAKKSNIYGGQDIIYNINSLIDTNILNSKNRGIAKQVFNFDREKFYILCGAQSLEDPRKGFKYFIEAIRILEDKLPNHLKEKVVLVVVTRVVSQEFEELTFEKHKIEYIKDYRLLSLLYQSIDLYVNTSVEDSGPMMVSEALACGTPVVGFDTGVVTNMVENNKNGFKIPIGDSFELSLGIEKILKLDESEFANFSNYSVKKVEKCSSFDYAKEIFNKILC